MILQCLAMWPGLLVLILGHGHPEQSQLAGKAMIKDDQFV